MSARPKEMAGKTRLEWIRHNHGEAKAAEFRVEAGPLEWLIGHLEDLGWQRSTSGFNGREYEPLDWRDIHAWMCSTGTQLAPRYLRGLIRLSKECAAMAGMASDVSCEAPFDPDGE